MQLNNKEKLRVFLWFVENATKMHFKLQQAHPFLTVAIAQKKKRNGNRFSRIKDTEFTNYSTLLSKDKLTFNLI